MASGTIQQFNNVYTRIGTVNEGSTLNLSFSDIFGSNSNVAFLCFTRGNRESIWIVSADTSLHKTMVMNVGNNSNTISVVGKVDGVTITNSDQEYDNYVVVQRIKNK